MKLTRSLPAIRAAALSLRRGLRFVVVFVFSSTLLLGFYYFPYRDESSIKPWLDAFLHRYAAAAGFVLRLFDPQVHVIGQEIVGRCSLRIVKTCDAMDVTILLVSAILASSNSWRRRIVGAATAVLLLHILNVLRICSLYCIGSMWPSFFEVAHLDLWPAIILLVAVGLFFALNGGRLGPEPENSHEPT